MKRKLLLALVSACLALRVSAVTIDFENIPQTYWNSGGDQNLGNYFAGVTFGPGAKILEDQVFGYNSTGYPPRSGHAVLWSESESVESGYSTIDVIFSNAVESFSFWTSTYYPVRVYAYDSEGIQLDFDSVTGMPSSYQELSMTHASADIARIQIIGSDGYWVMDDFTFSDPPKTGVPDTGATLAMLSGAFLCLAALRRRIVA